MDKIELRQICLQYKIIRSWTQAKMAEEVGVSLPAYQMFETNLVAGKRVIGKIEYFLKKSRLI